MVILAPVMLLSNVLLSGFVFLTFLIKVCTIVDTCIANEIGNPLMVDAPKSGLAWGPFLRIRVDIDITKPLMRRKMIHIENVEEGWVFFKYERLPIFCYHCGILGH